MYIFYEQLKVYLERKNILPQLNEAINKETVFVAMYLVLWFVQFLKQEIRMRLFPDPSIILNIYLL